MGLSRTVTRNCKPGPEVEAGKTRAGRLLERRAPELQARPAGRGRDPAFTLIELLVVIAIIAVLIGLLIPAVEQGTPVDPPCKTDTNGEAAAAFLEIWKTEHDFRNDDLDGDSNHDYGTLAQLIQFADLEARIGVDDFSSGIHAGHTFELQLVDGGQGFFLRARPLSPNVNNDPIIEADAITATCKDPPATIQLSAVLHGPAIQFLQDISGRYGDLPLDSLQETFANPESAALLRSALDQDGDRHVALTELTGSDILRTAAALRPRLFPRLPPGDPIGEDTELDGLLRGFLGLVEKRAIATGMERVRLPVDGPRVDPLAVLHSALGHRLSLGDATVSRCGDLRRLPVLLDTSQPAGGLQVALEWSPGGSLEVAGIVPGLDVAPGDIEAFTFDVPAAVGGRAAASLTLKPGLTLGPGAALEVLTLWVRAAAGAGAADMVAFCPVTGPREPPLTTSVLVLGERGLESVQPALACGEVAVVSGDADPPVIACPGPLEVAGTARGAVVEYRVVAAARCGEVRLACDPPSGSMFPPGTTEVNCVAENEAGVTSRCSFEVTVREGDSFSFLRGDCNGDGEVVGTVTDAVFLLQFNFLGGPEPLCLAACDANGDGEVGGVVTDAVYVLAFNFLGGRSPVDPFPACGASSSAADAALGCESPPQSCR